MNPSSWAGTSLNLSALGRRVHITCDDAPLARLLFRHYQPMVVDSDALAADLRYAVDGGGAPGCRLACPGRAEAVALADAAALLFELDHDLTIELQKRRPDLLFVHAAVLERGGKACLLVGDSGHGKSTTAWGLLHHGFRYLSDELGPVAPASSTVFPFPRALGLKRAPPAGYPLPSGLPDLGGALYVPASLLPTAAVSHGCRLGAVLFVHHRDPAAAPALRPIGRAEAAARLYANALNPLAHAERGLDAALQVVSGLAAWTLETGDLRQTCLAVEGLMARVPA